MKKVQNEVPGIAYAKCYGCGCSVESEEPAGLFLGQFCEDCASRFVFFEGRWFERIDTGERVELLSVDESKPQSRPVVAVGVTPEAAATLKSAVKIGERMCVGAVPDNYHAGAYAVQYDCKGFELGLELEVELASPEKRDALVTFVKSHELFRGERDGSLSQSLGLEIVGPPLRIGEYESSAWPGICQAVRDNASPEFLQGRRAGYGLHVHVATPRRITDEDCQMLSDAVASLPAWAAGLLFGREYANRARPVISWRDRNRMEVRAFIARTSWPSIVRCLLLSRALGRIVERGRTYDSIVREKGLIAALYALVTKHPKTYAPIAGQVAACFAAMESGVKPCETCSAEFEPVEIGGAL